MMLTINKTCLCGNVSADPDIKMLEGGRRLAVMMLATNERWTDSVGRMKERTDWHRIVVIDARNIDFLDAVVRRGSQIYVEGKLQTRRYVPDDGLERTVVEVLVNHLGTIQLVSRPPSAIEPHDNEVLAA